MNILVPNPDYQVIEGAIDRVVTVLRSTDRVGGMVGPLLLNPDGSEHAGGRRTRRRRATGSRPDSGARRAVLRLHLIIFHS